MGKVSFYRDAHLPFFELKICDTSYLSYKRHSHEEYSLGIVEQGESSFWYEGRQDDVASGSLVLIPPHTLHACNPQENDNWRYKMLFVHSGWVQSFWAGQGLQGTELPVVKSFLSPAEKYEIVRHIDSFKSDISPLEKETGIMSVFLKLLNCAGGCVSEHSPADVRPRVKIIRDYLHGHFSEKITLDQLEKVSRLNKFYIVRLFNSTYNIPPHAYQTLLRINYAKRELRKQRRTVDIALEAGFCDQSHFIKVFKGYVGTTPELYQKSI